MNKILGIEPISDGLCKLKIKGKIYNIILINIFGAAGDKGEDIKEQVYEELERT